MIFNGFFPVAISILGSGFLLIYGSDVHEIDGCVVMEAAMGDARQHLIRLAVIPSRSVPSAKKKQVQ